MKKLALIVAAYNTQNYIMECVDSILNQDKINGWEIELRIGVDNCFKTAEVLTKNKIPFYWSVQNVGAYIMRNSLIYLSYADKYCYFDSDDKMFKNYCKKSLEGNHEVTMTAKINCNQNMIPIQGSKIEYGGAITFSNNILNALGGFYGKRCAADSDFMARIKMAGYSIYEINEPLYYRRRHAQSLTKKADTGMGSPYRKQAWADMTEKRKQGIIKIKPTLVKLEKR